MIIFISNIVDLQDEVTFEEGYRLVSKSRKQKIDATKIALKKQQSLGAGLLLNHAVRMWQRFLSGATDLVLNTLNEVLVNELIDGYDDTFDYEIVLGKEGKPMFSEHDNLFFNISHAKDYVVCAVSDSPVGVDIEGGRSMNTNVANRYYKESEIKWIESKDSEKHFFRIWTLKEAYGKLTGEGIFNTIKELEFIWDESDNKFLLYRNGTIQDINILEFEKDEYCISAINLQKHF